jgi:hypothetical protein
LEEGNVKDVDSSVKDNEIVSSAFFCGEINGTAPPPPPPPPPTSTNGPHDKRCDCGCVPQIYSLFEMAELRKQARLKKEAELKKWVAKLN